MTFLLKFILLATFIPFASLGLQMKYFQVIGLTGLDSLTPKFTKWIQESKSIFSKPLGACSACNFFWINAIQYAAVGVYAHIYTDIELVGISIFMLAYFFFFTYVKTQK